MNHSLAFLVLKHQHGSNFLSVASASLSPRLTVKGSSFSNFFSSFLFSNSRALSVSMSSVKFANFRASAVSLSSVDAVTYSETQNFVNTTINLTKCFFASCYADKTNGGAISCASLENNVSLKFCQFQKCMSMSVKAGAIYIPQSTAIKIAKSCFTQCSANESSHVILAVCQNGQINITECTFTENGKPDVPLLSDFSGGYLSYIGTNTTFNIVKNGAFFAVSKPKSVVLMHSYWVSNEGLAAIVHPQSSTKGDIWTYNNIMMNHLKESVVTGSIDATISFLVMKTNVFTHFLDVDQSSTLHLDQCFFDFGRIALKNKGEDEPTIDYREGVMFDSNDVTKLKVSVAAHDYCWAFKAKRPFTFGKNPVAIINQLNVSKHPHMVFFMSAFFILIILIVFFLLQRKTELRQGMMRNL